MNQTSADLGSRKESASLRKTLAQQAPTIPEIEVRFAHFPYFDHTQSIIGLKQGWFKKAGITFVPDNVGIVVKAEDASAVFHDGWVATDEWINANYETVLRLASVGFRINQFIADSPDKAAAIHTPFLNSVAGTTFEDKVANVAYTSLHPFWLFDQQTGWITDKSNPLNAEYVIGSAIKTYEEQGLFKKGEFTWDKFTAVNKIYADLVDYRTKTDALFKKMEGATLSAEADALRQKAKAFYAAFNFLDAHRFATAAAGG